MDDRTTMEDSPIRQERPGTARLELGIAILIALGAGYLAVAMPTFVDEGGIQQAQDFLRLSPVFFPRLSFGLTSLISIILVFRIMTTLPGRETRTLTLDGKKYLNVLIMSVLIVIYALMLPFFGYGIATLLAVAVTTYFLGMRAWLPLLAFSFVTPVLTRFIFERLLAIALPLSRYDRLAEFEQELMGFLAGIFF